MALRCAEKADLWGTVARMASRMASGADWGVPRPVRWQVKAKRTRASFCGHVRTKKFKAPDLARSFNCAFFAQELVRWLSRKWMCSRCRGSGLGAPISRNCQHRERCRDRYGHFVNHM
jgi:hypothetical protein